MPFLAVGALEVLLLVVACASAALVRPWRLLAHDSSYSLAGPLACAVAALSLLWWWPGVVLSPLFTLFGASLALLALGWPLAVFSFVMAGLFGMLAGAGWDAAVTAAFWNGVLPATLALALGHGVRLLAPRDPVSYLLGRAFLVPLGSIFSCALLAHWALDRFNGLGEHAPAALLLAALLEAMLTGMVATLLVIHAPRCIATWSQKLYVPDAGDGAQGLVR